MTLSFEARRVGRTGAADESAEPIQVVPPGDIGLPPNKKCVDRRKFAFNLKRVSDRRVVRVEVYVKRGRGSGLGKRKKVVTGTNIERLAINRLPKRRFKVTIRTTHDDGSRLESCRIYKGCKKSKPKTRRVR